MTRSTREVSCNVLTAPVVLCANRVNTPPNRLKAKSGIFSIKRGGRSFVKRTRSKGKTSKSKRTIGNVTAMGLDIIANVKKKIRRLYPKRFFSRT